MAFLTLPLLLLRRGTVNPGVIAGTEVATTENEDAEKNASTRGRIIAIAVSVVILVVVITIAICYDRSKKRKARQGTKLRELGPEADEEARPMVYGQVPVGRNSMVQPSQSAGAYAGAGYGQAVVGASYHPGQVGEEYAGGYGQGPAPLYSHLPAGGQEGYRGQ